MNSIKSKLKQIIGISMLNKKEVFAFQDNKIYLFLFNIYRDVKLKTYFIHLKTNILNS
jgi:hypothetical protein